MTLRAKAGHWETEKAGHPARAAEAASNTSQETGDRREPVGASGLDASGLKDYHAPRRRAAAFFGLFPLRDGAAGRKGVIPIQNEDAFSSCHPLVNFLYFALVLVFTMFFMHPVCLAISLGSAVIYHIHLNGRKGARFQLTVMLPIVLFAAILNPVFNHEGETILTYLPTGNPLTLESILYGLAAAVLLASVVLWFSCYTAVMTSDKFVYLFGRVIPSLSLVLSMTLRFIPKFRDQFQVVREAQKCVGRDVSNGGLVQRLRHAVTIISIMLTWCMENAIETADSMKSRGYGLPGRTAFSIYTMDKRDRSVLIWLIFCGVFIACGWAAGGMSWRYYPTVQGNGVSLLGVCFQLVYLALCLTPVILDRKEDAVWKHLRSEI